MWLVWLGILLSYSVAHAQSIVSDNILTPSTSAWSGSVTGQNGGFTGGGNGPAYNPTTNTLIFGYTERTATQRITAEAFAIQHALDLSNSGIKINGYNYSWYINNSGEQSGTLSGQVQLLRGTSILRTDTYNYNAPTNNFQLFSGTQTFANPESMLAGDAMTVSFTGKDNRFWAGYYGPQVRSPSITLNYTSDPCAGNPAYSPSCANYNTVTTSPNLFTGMTGTQAYAINQALSHAGAGAMIHGFNYGYDYNVAGRQCAIWDLFGFCLSGWNYSDAGVGVAITSDTGSTLYSTSHTYNGGDNGRVGTSNYQYRFGTSRQITTLGGFAISPWTSGNASITNMYSNALYTPDPCLDPLSSPSCSGYAEAYKQQQCTANPLYDMTCSGYAAAYQTQQCTINALYSPSCPGYAEAYFNQQCTANQLYNQSCPGYAAAYLAQQCSANPLYSTTCNGYATAYFNQQCSLNGLYDRTCPNYSEAYATKMVLEKQGIASTVATAGVIAQSAPKESTTTASTSLSSDGSVSVGVSKTGDSNVDKVIAAPAPTTNSSAAPSAPVQLVQAPPPPSPPPAARNEGGERKAEGGEKKPEGGERKAEGGDKPAGGPQQAQGRDTEGARPAPTARQELQARREAAARAEAVAKGKDLANEMGKVDNMEQQKQIQNVVIQAMGFTAGFDTYSHFRMIDNTFYKPVTIYGGTNVDNRNAGRGLFGATDKTHNEMVESQFNLTK